MSVALTFILTLVLPCGLAVGVLMWASREHQGSAMDADIRAHAVRTPYKIEPVREWPEPPEVESALMLTWPAKEAS